MPDAVERNKHINEVDIQDTAIKVYSPQKTLLFIRTTYFTNFGNHFNSTRKSLKTNESVLNKVIVLLVNMISCIKLDLDHRLHMKKLMPSFTENFLDIIRQDLDNLLFFETRDIYSVLLSLQINTFRIQRDENLESTNIVSSKDEHFPTSRFILKFAIENVVKFLIFRKPLTSFHPVKGNVMCKFSFATELTDHSYNRIDLQEIKSRIRLCKYRAIARNKLKKRYYRNRRLYNWKLNIIDSSLNVFNEDDGGRKTWERLCDNNHSCHKIYCFLCYGWLWMLLYYCSAILYNLAINISHSLMIAVASVLISS